MKKKIWVIVLIAVGVGGYLFLSGNWSNMTNWTYRTYMTNKSERTNAQTAEEINQRMIEQNQPKNFTDPDLGFSFSYPPEYSVSTMEDGDAKTILIQKAGKGMQLYVAPYGEGDVTASLVNREIKDVKVQNLTDINLPQGGKATTFFYQDASLGGVWNVWFSRDKHLFQLTAEADHEKAIKLFVETFSFGE